MLVHGAHSQYSLALTFKRRRKKANRETIKVQINCFTHEFAYACVLHRMLSTPRVLHCMERFVIVLLFGKCDIILLLLLLLL